MVDDKGRKRKKITPRSILPLLCITIHQFTLVPCKGKRTRILRDFRNNKLSRMRKDRVRRSFTRLFCKRKKKRKHKNEKEAKKKNERKKEKNISPSNGATNHSMELAVVAVAVATAATRKGRKAVSLNIHYPHHHSIYTHVNGKTSEDVRPIKLVRPVEAFRM